MATRKKTTADALTGKPAGWQEQIAQPTAPTPKKSRGRLARKTYLMTDELIERIESFAESHGVGINEAMRFALITGLDAIDAGSVPVETQAVTKHSLGV